jgi:hypothetical protein
MTYTLRPDPNTARIDDVRQYLPSPTFGGCTLRNNLIGELAKARTVSPSEFLYVDESAAHVSLHAQRAETKTRTMRGRAEHLSTGCKGFANGEFVPYREAANGSFPWVPSPKRSFGFRASFRPQKQSFSEKSSRECEGLPQPIVALSRAELANPSPIPLRASASGAPPELGGGASD